MPNFKFVEETSFAIYILLLIVPDFHFVAERFLRYIYTPVICTRLSFCCRAFPLLYIYSCYLCQTLNLLKSVSFAIYILLLFVPDFKFVEECFLRYIYTPVICGMTFIRNFRM